MQVTVCVSFSEAMAPYMLWDSSASQLQVFVTLSKSLATRSQKRTQVDVGCPLKGEEAVDAAAFHRLANTNDALP